VKKTMTRFLGVVGGMGPLATADFLAKLVEKTGAPNDQENIPILVYGDCTTPDRTASVLGEGPSPLPKLVEAVEFLSAAEVVAICVPCNSAHVWFDEMRAASRAPLLHIVEATVAVIRSRNPEAKTVGVLSTLGVGRTGIYPTVLSRLGFHTLAPTDDEFATLVSPAIAHIKANRIHEAEPLLESAAAKLQARGADVIVLGCTEIPLGMKRQCQSEPARYIDSTEALVLSAIEAYSHARSGPTTRDHG
jgi:aspartate racemase